MSEQWFRDYVQLQFRMDKAIRKFTESRFVDYYYGPAEWKAAVENEAEKPTPDLVRAAMALLDALPAQGFEEHRALYLSKQVIALETVCRKLNGETFTLEDEVQKCFDIRPTWTPETRFEEAHALYDEILPGNGSIFERLQAFRKRYNLASEKAGLIVDFMRQAMNEAHRRVLTFIDLPQGEEVELDVVSDQVFGGENWYLGNYHSRVELNTDLPTNMRWLIDLVCHEGYPGHHTEFVLKEQHLYRERGYIEQAIAPIICPQSVISEGIATSAFDMIFTHTEAEQWARKHLYPAAGIEPIDIDTEKVSRAGELMAGIDGNARFMMSDDRPDDEVKQYIMKYALLPEEYAQKDLEFLRDPFREGYIFTYFYGRRLMRPCLQGNDRQQVFTRFLTEQICPSDLVNSM
ncbi:MAG TPA: hypothetical protein VFQ36_23130 [Ktedonobacteraceae bacterium]|nr:hypothetical protein [Ktedonobacteraceae bacterium]